MEQYPEELREKPVPVIALVGGGARIHSAVTANLSFVPETIESSENNGENKPKSVVFLSFQRGENLVKPKTVTNTPATTHVEDSPGILKANWLYRHTRLVPSVLIFFFPEWGKIAKWKDKENGFCALIEQTRYAFSLCL